MPSILSKAIDFKLLLIITNDSAKCDMSTNYSNVQDVLRDALFSVDPIDLSEVDRILDTLSDLGDTISIAVSMACCRAGARHKGMRVYSVQYLITYDYIHTFKVCI
jgi:enolase